MRHFNRNESIITFLKEIEKFKTCERTCQTSQVGRNESDAEHTWHLAILLILIENELKDINFVKLLKIALIHDLPEIYAGDTNPYRDDTSNKKQKEALAAQKIFSGLPNDLNDSLASLFHDYLNQESKEAQLVKSADKLMPLIQNLCTCNRYSSYKELKVKIEEVTKYMDQFFKNDDILKLLYEDLLKESYRQNIFFSRLKDTKDEHF